LTRISFPVMLNINMNQAYLSRRNFIKLLGFGIAGIGFRPLSSVKNQVEFPPYDRLGRVCIIGRVNVKAEPYEDSQTVGELYEDAVVPWLREVVAKEPNYNFFNQKWVETPDGYVYAAYLQPVRNYPNPAIDALLPTSTGEGMWAEVTIPYADVVLVNNPSSHSWVSSRIDQGLPIRVYYGQVYYIDQIKTDDHGNKFYRANPNYYGGVDMFWVPAKAMHAIKPEEITPINPDAENKKIIVDVNKQELSCYEGDTEVCYCRVSTGAKYDMYGNTVEKWATPIGTYLISRKYISLQMSGGTTGAPYDLPGIGWASIFATGGVAIHATVWHNDFGTPKSHGCVNTLPEDAKWIFRWGLPNVSYDPGMVDISISGDKSSTVQVIES
jgi:lipoprotein-anchoring transpeptidase ErfK/SrfK